MTVIQYARGDATRPAGDGPKVIAHVCNDQGGWGRGFVLALSRRWVAPEYAYRDWHRRGSLVGPVGDRSRQRQLRVPAMRSEVAVEETGVFGLGQSQLVEVEFGCFVLNMVAQHGIFPGPGAAPPLRYDALALCLRHADAFCRRLGASLHAPRIGCGLAGGSWEHVGMLVERLVSADVTVYDLPGGTMLG